jgi:hypothetical protein
MIAISRAAVRQFRLAAWRCRLPGRLRGGVPPVRITANGDTVTIAARLGEVANAWEDRYSLYTKSHCALSARLCHFWISLTPAAGPGRRGVITGLPQSRWNVDRGRTVCRNDQQPFFGIAVANTRSPFSERSGSTERTRSSPYGRQDPVQAIRSK